MYQNTRHAAVSSVRVHATVMDMTGVQRVLTLLTGRNYSLTRFEAEEAGGGRWAAAHRIGRRPTPRTGRTPRGAPAPGAQHPRRRRAVERRHTGTAEQRAAAGSPAA